MPYGKAIQPAGVVVMQLKSFYFFLLLTAVFKKAFTACTRMQRYVNRSHTSLTKGTVKRPGLDH